MARAKGDTNKSTKKFAKALEMLGFNVPNEMVKLFRETQEPLTKLRIIDAIARYSHAKPEPEPAVVEKPEEDSVDVATSDLLDLLKK